MNIKNEIEVKLEIFFIKENNSIIAYSPSLDLSAYGNSISDAKKSFETTFKIYIEETEKKGTLIDDLLDHGWTVQKVPSLKLTPPKLNKKEIFLTHSIIKEDKRLFKLSA
ncbi:MAG: hypothetical protein M3R36_18310 [Bacteroidota bacterium]|nr:hypothetical protein [Bacteroidota bacterium]